MVEFVVIVLLAFCLLRLKGRCTLEITEKKRLSLNNVESQTVIAGIEGILKNTSKTEDNPKSEMKKEVIVNKGAEDRPSKTAENSYQGKSVNSCKGDSYQGKNQNSCERKSEDSRKNENSCQGESEEMESGNLCQVISNEGAMNSDD